MQSLDSSDAGWRVARASRPSSGTMTRILPELEDEEINIWMQLNVCGKEGGRQENGKESLYGYFKCIYIWWGQERRTEMELGAL